MTWTDSTNDSTAWTGQTDHLETTLTIGSPIGLLLSLTHAITQAINPGSFNWTDVSGQSTAWTS